MAEIASLSIADPPGLWADLGFAVDDGRAWISGIGHELGAPGAGVVAWTLRPPAAGAPSGRRAPAGGAGSGGGAEGGRVGELTELPVAAGAPPSPPDPRPHPNGVIALDHVVIATPDLDRTVDAFVAAGLRLRRTREAGTAQRPLRQAFFRLGPAIAEIVGPPAPSGRGPARFFGLAFTVADLDATAAFLGHRLQPAIAAVQPGRRIATLDRSAGSTVAMAFMSADPLAASR